MWKIFRWKEKEVVKVQEIPEIPLPQGVLHYQTPPPYVEPTDAEMMEGLCENEHYAEAFRIKELKREVANLKRKLTILQKKYDGVNQP